MPLSESHPGLDIRAYALVGRERTTCEFDETNATLLDQSLRDIEKVFSFKYISILKGCDLGTEARFHAFALTKTSQDVLVSALHMARQRAGVEAFTLLRVALDAACTSHHILKDDAAYKQYLAGEYCSTWSVTPMKASIPCIGEIWGAFSKARVHTNRRVFGPRCRLDGDSVVTAELRFDVSGVRPHTPRQDVLLLTAVSLVAMILLKTLENNNIEDGPANLSEKHIAGTNLHQVHGTDARITHYYQALRECTEEE